MSVAKKLAAVVKECAHCLGFCANETFQITHQFVGSKKRSTLLFCSKECMVEHFEIHEQVLERISVQVKKEIAELHKRVCPACVRRFAELQ